MSALKQEITTLEWYVDAGVDEALEESPRNYFAENNSISLPPSGGRSGGGHATHLEPQTTPSATLPLKREGVIGKNASLAQTIAEARRLADAATTLEELKDAICNFEGCAIKKTASKTVFGDGNPKSRLMLVGEAPGADEDREGIPFCGVSGKLLDKMLAAIGYDRTRYYITNTVWWRPPGNRQPSIDELAICKPFIEKYVALIDPELLVLVGGVAAKALLETELGITRLRGKNYTYRTPYKDRDYSVTIIYHPSYLLRQPTAKRAAWQDLLAIQKLLSAKS